MVGRLTGGGTSVACVGEEGAGRVLARASCLARTAGITSSSTATGSVAGGRWAGSGAC
jgi:hypothetical protein